MSPTLRSGSNILISYKKMIYKGFFNAFILFKRGSLNKIKKEGINLNINNFFESHSSKETI